MKTNTGLVEYCKAQLGKPYWYGSSGEQATLELYNRLAQQTHTRKQIIQFSQLSYQKQFGQKVHDCSGLIKGYLWCKTADAFFNHKNYDAVIDGGITYDKCTEKGNIETMPEIKGLLVFKSGHVGVYIGNGEVIEAKGHAYGVVKTRFKDGKWIKWGKCKFITYEEEAMTKEEKLKLIQDKVGLDDNTMQYLQFYRFGDALIDKLANALK